MRNAQDSCVKDIRKAARENLVVRDGNGWIVLLGENGREMIIKTRRVVRRIGDDEGETTCLGLDVFVFDFS